MNTDRPKSRWIAMSLLLAGACFFWRDGRPCGRCSASPALVETGACPQSGGRQAENHLLRRPSGRQRVLRRGRSRPVGGPRPPREIRLLHERGHRSLGHGRRTARPAPHRRGPEMCRDSRHRDGSARHPRRRADAHPGEPKDHRPADPPVAGGHRDVPSAERLSPGPSERRDC